jgi:prepilin-type N-terminal cleavage/methylation domain-containing protein
MNTFTRTHGRGQRGYTLMEILVAVSIFAIVILAALALYDRSNRVFKTSVESSDMQQSTRVAFDKVSADLRMAGFDYDRDGTPFGALASTWLPETTYTSGMLVQPPNPNGHTYICINGGLSAKTEPVWPEGDKEQVKDGGTVVWQENGTLLYQQPDEQIEYAGKSAVVLRANFNYDTATGPCTALDPCEGGREPNLESTEFPVVTTANNEIVAYALKPMKGTATDSLVFYADTSIPRKANPTTDAKENKITITGVDLCTNGCTNPPYTLYRYTVQDDGTADAGTPVAENIRSMSFKYYTTTNAATADEITTYPNGDGQYDGGNPEASVPARETRATIRAVELTLVGMNAQPDYNYSNPADTVANNYRTLELKSLIAPRNTGRRGMKEYNTDLPGKPSLKSICAGGCNSVFLTWAAPSSGGDIESYAILYDPDKCQGTEMPTGGYQYAEEIGLSLSGSIGRYLQPGQEYSFAVQAISKWGAATSNCMGPIKVINKTKPEALKDLVATNPKSTDPAYAALPNQVDLYFPAAAMNVAGEDKLSCMDGGVLTEQVMSPPEKRYYEIWRAKDNPNFQPGDPGSVRILEAGSTIQPVGDPAKFSDTTAANCIDYYYRIRVVDYCARKPEWNDPAQQSQGESDYYPALDKEAIYGRAVSEVKPQKPTLTLIKADCTGASGNCDLTFTWNAITRNEDDEPITVSKYILQAYQSTDNGASWKSPVSYPMSNGELTTTNTVKPSELWKFDLIARDCNDSEPSNEVIYPCIFNAGALSAGISAGTYSGSGSQGDPYIVEDATVTATTTDKVQEFRVSIVDTSNGSQFAALSQSGGINTASWAVPNMPDDHLMQILVTAVDDKGCTKVTEFYARDSKAPACSLSDSGSDVSIVTVNKSDVVYTLKNLSSSALTIKKIIVNINKPSGKSLPAVIFNGTSVTTGCTKSSLMVNAPSGATIPANSSSYKLTLDYQDSNLQDVNPTVSLCIEYQVPSGDILICQIAPGSGTCTELASTCQ